MLKFEIGTGDIDCLEAEGDLTVLSTEMLMAIGMVYKMISSKRLEAAESYKYCITEAVKDGIPFKSNGELFEHFMKKLKDDLREADN